MADPSSYASRILFAVSGLSPQIITETIYWLATQREPRFVPTRVVVMTTTEGAHRVRLLLLGKEPGWLARLARDYHLPDIPLAAEDLRVIANRAGEPLDDIRTDADNTAAANAIIAGVAELTRDPGCAVHVSIAGGRKTLGFFAGYALSLCGREQDRMSHVLVSSDFETHPGFFYPTPYSRVIMTRDNRPLDCRDASLALADLPFVRMRGGLPEALRTGRASYAEAVDALQGRLAAPRLVIDLRRRQVIAGRQPVRLAPSELALLTWLARRSLAGCPWLEKRQNEPQAQRLRDAKEYLNEYKDLVLLDDRDAVLAALKDGLDLDLFRQKISKLNRELAAQVVDPSPGRYLVQRTGTRNRYSWGLTLPADAITIRD
jgi:CRISPR-associated protein (TIGR02584 family)